MSRATARHAGVRILCRHALPLLAGLTVLPGAAAAADPEPREAATLVLADCPAGTIDSAAVNALLGIELPREDIVLARGPLTERPLTLRLRCLPEPGQLLLAAEEVQRREERALSLLDVAPSLRPRTLALALAELVRRMRQTPPATPSSPVSPPQLQATPPPLAAGRSAPSLRRLKVSGRVALGLAVTTVATSLIGVGLTAAGSQNLSNSAYRGGAVGLFSIGTAALVGTAASFGVWAHERRRVRDSSPKSVQVGAGIAPLRGGGGLVLTGSF